MTAWIQDLQSRGGVLVAHALDWIDWQCGGSFPSGGLGVLRLADALRTFASEECAQGNQEADDQRFIDGAGAMLALLLLHHIGTGEHRQRGTEHRVALGRFGFFDPFAAIHGALDAPDPVAHLRGQLEQAEAEARGEGTYSRVVSAFQECLAETHPNVQIDSQYEYALTLTGGTQVDLSRVAVATSGEPKETVRRAVARIVSLLPQATETPTNGSLDAPRNRPAASDIPWEEAAPRVLPRLISASFADPLGDAVFLRPFHHDVKLALVLSYTDRARYVRSNEVATWGDARVILRKALENLAARSEQARFATIEADAGRLVVAQSRDGLDAARLLLPGLQRVLEGEIEPPWVAGIPHRDMLIACSAKQPRAVRHLTTLVADHAARASHRISERLFPVGRV